MVAKKQLTMHLPKATYCITGGAGGFAEGWGDKYNPFGVFCAPPPLLLPRLLDIYFRHGVMFDVEGENSSASLYGCSGKNRVVHINAMTWLPFPVQRSCYIDN